MIKNKRTLTFIGIALLVGVALAFAVAMSRTDSSAGTTGQYVSGAPIEDNAILADDVLAADPARRQPSLDQFTSKDPFIPLDVAANTGTDGTGGTGNGNNGGTAGDTSLSAGIKVNGKSYTVAAGDKVPGGDPVFTIASITSSDVTFKLIDAQFSDGSDSVTVKVGETVVAKSKDGSKEYRLEVVKIGDKGAAGTNGHSISVLSINSQGGTATVTLKVDGQTYADKREGDTFTTGWGEIKILSINVGAQTVTIMHGDQTLTLRAGQAVVK